MQGLGAVYRGHLSQLIWRLIMPPPTHDFGCAPVPCSTPPPMTRAAYAGVWSSLRKPSSSCGGWLACANVHSVQTRVPAWVVQSECQGLVLGNCSLIQLTSPPSAWHLPTGTAVWCPACRAELHRSCCLSWSRMLPSAFCTCRSVLPACHCVLRNHTHGNP